MLTVARVAVQQIAYDAWHQGTNTVLSIAAGRARATSVGVNNPRISRHVTGLVAGATYSTAFNVYSGTQTGNIFARASADADLTLADYDEFITATSAPAFLQFIAPAGGAVYIGIVTVCNADGQYAEVDDIISVIRV